MKGDWKHKWEPIYASSLVGPISVPDWATQLYQCSVCKRITASWRPTKKLKTSDWRRLGVKICQTEMVKHIHES